MFTSALLQGSCSDIWAVLARDSSCVGVLRKETPESRAWMALSHDQASHSQAVGCTVPSVRVRRGRREGTGQKNWFVHKIAFLRVHAKGVVLCERACFCLLSAF